jgi:tripartite-type tricarboxylate transporter receptor subunit TctC
MSGTKNRMRIIVAAAVAWAAVVAPSAKADDYPNHVIKLIIGFPPGGNVDSVGRVLAQELAKGLGQPVVVENKPGVVGSLAAELVSRMPADGYTLLLVPGAHPVNAAIHKSLNYKPVDDFEWISMATSYPFAISVRGASPLHSLKDLLAAAKAKPGVVSNGSSGSGSVQHMTAELLANAAGVKFLEVPYKGEALALTAALAGEVDFVVTTTTLVVPHLGSGALRPLAVTSKTAWKELPGVPTVDQSGVPGFEVMSWSGLAAPHGTPRPIVDRLNAEIRRAIAVPDVRARLESFGGDVHATTPEDMKAQVAREVAVWTKLVQDAKMERE